MRERTILYTSCGSISQQLCCVWFRLMRHFRYIVHIIIHCFKLRRATPSLPRTTCCMRTPRPRIHPVIFFALLESKERSWKNMALRPQACPFKIWIPICLPSEHQEQLPWFTNRWQSLFAVRFFFQGADSYVCFASRNFAAHKSECVFHSETLHPDPFNSGKSAFRILVLYFRKQNASIEQKLRSVYAAQLHIYLHQAHVLRPSCVPENWM